MFTTKILASSALLAACIASPVWAGSLSTNHTVVDRNGHVVHSLANGSCVRSQWQAGSDECKPAVKEEKVVVTPPAPPPAPKTVLSKDQSSVLFDFDSAQLTPAAQQNLDQVASTLGAAKDVRQADIVGYADRIGNSKYNVALSEKRAKAVAAYLNSKGYAHTNVTEVRGLGATNSKTQCSESLKREERITCLAQDRRVELEVVYAEQQLAPTASSASPSASEIQQ